MEVEPSPPVVAKKLWNIIRVVFFMVRNGICKSKMMVDLHLMFKRGKLAGKAIANNLIFHNNNLSSLSCKSNDSLSFISPREYEFSCSNSPSKYNPFHFNKRKHHHNFFNKSYGYDDVTTVNAVQKVLEMLNNDIVEASPLVTLPGFGKSPMVRQLRVTDSPFPLKDEGDSQVDKQAEEFIKNFYKDLKLQKRKAAIESPYHNMWGR
uniref:Avr9/Cf-9 rapidly elicited protein 146 n=1 Tax=Fagus sylvatica TaxID=28930 RepID=A0A2N9GB46_FAGSY